MANFLKTTGCAFTTKEMFYNFPIDKVDIDYKDSLKYTSSTHKEDLIKQIFTENYFMVIEDIVDNNVTFKLPLTGGRTSDIHFKRITGDGFTKLFRAGKWQNMDFLKSMFSGYQLSLYRYGKMSPRIKPIYLSKSLQDKIINNINNGKQYC